MDLSLLNFRYAIEGDPAHDATIATVGVTAEALGALIALVDGGTISTTVAKGVFEQMYGTGRQAAAATAAAWPAGRWA